MGKFIYTLALFTEDEIKTVLIPISEQYVLCRNGDG